VALISAHRGACSEMLRAQQIGHGSTTIPRLMSVPRWSLGEKTRNSGRDRESPWRLICKELATGMSWSELRLILEKGQRVHGRTTDQLHVPTKSRVDGNGLPMNARRPTIPKTIHNSPKRNYNLLTAVRNYDGFFRVIIRNQNMGRHGCAASLNAGSERGYDLFTATQFL
jgi:hypothetical protein